MKFELKNRGNKKAEMFIYEEIGSGWMGGISAKDVNAALKDIGTMDEIKVRINSPGGSVFDGFAIYNSLVKNSAKIIVEIDGLAASIASIIAMAGDEIGMASNAMMMIHDPWTMTAGSASDLREQADLLDKLRDQLVNTYARKSTLESSAISDMMGKETWMDSDEALEMGFIDNITDEMQVAAHFDLSKFKHPPKTLQERVSAPTIQSMSRSVVNDRIKLMTTRLQKRGLK